MTVSNVTAKEPNAKRVVNRSFTTESVVEGVRQYAAILPTTDPKAIAVHLALWQAHHAQYMANSRAIEALDLPVSVTGSRLTVVRTLYCAPGRRMTLGTLSKRTRLSPAAVTNLVDSLSRGSLVRRVGSTEDRRVNIAELTEKGEAAFHKILPAMSESMTSACAGLTDEEKDTLLRLLQRLSYPS
jgi:DNA-binding MarR family transcriptional regulator